MLVFGVFTAGSELIAAFKMEDRVQSSYVMFVIIFLSPLMLYFLLAAIYLGITRKPEELAKNRKKKKKKKSITLHDRIIGFCLAIALLGFVVSIPLSLYMHFKLLDAGYVVCERKSAKAPTWYAKEKELCH
ncbi:DUF1240 domain-containing protein [Xenorhabdus hominickii]|uniref:Membrane protein n=1 Tax=Xenorhabdus hominickii TaxID=351679 RepID=A0A2G0Q1J4_XENHO|nr:DUF1240 domain-containing protein [Xenorhabdus hominickii]AOM40400.1 hypothetical protein A9255_07290 [Xenorhabdus hominickii]PHM53075.1 membrane protein [Xenorhabdus hominickii]